MQPSDYVEIGRYLRDSRESLRLTLAGAARDLHIRVRYLEALESGNLDDLPGKAYTRGYIRTYAQYLRLNVDDVLNAYASLLGPKTAELFIPEPTSRQNLPTPSLIWLSLAGLISLCGYGYYTSHGHGAAWESVPDLPPKLAHLLDKPPLPGMDTAWGECMSAGGAGCTAVLRSHGLTHLTRELYDVQLPDTPPQEP